MYSKREAFRLTAKGLSVTLFATADSLTGAQLDACIEKPYAENPDSDAKVDECLHIAHLMEQADQFDIIHNHFDFLPLTYSGLIATPVVTTIHGFSSSKILPVYKKYNTTTSYVSISNSDRNADLDYIATVYNGIDTSQFTFSEIHEDYLLFFGRIHPHKGTAEAIDVARKCGKKIIIAGLIQDAAYFRESIEPFIDNDRVLYAGNCGPAERNRLLGGALALLHLIQFDEPFGLSVAEAMCCGTPVIAIRRGAMAELIIDGQTGFLVRNTDEAAEAVMKINSIQRKICRRHVMDSFSQEKMAEGYIEVYKKILGR